MRRRRAWLALGVAAGALAAAPAAGQTEVTSSAAEIEIAGRLHTQARTSSCADFPAAGEASACGEDVPAVDWFIRRARLTLTVRYNDWIEGRIQPEFGDLDAVELKDAWGRVRLHPHAAVKVGHFKRPFDGFQLTSSTRILTVERDIDIPGVPALRAASYDELTTRFRLSEWDVGVQVEGATAEDRFRYWVGAFNGRASQENGDLNTEKQFVARGQVTLDAGGLPLALAAAGALTDVPFTRPSGELGGEYFGALELWAELGSFEPGLHLQAGLVLSENPLQDRQGGPLELESGGRMADALAWQVIGAYRFGVTGRYFIEAVEPLFRITRTDPNRDLGEDAAWGLTPGVQIFFDGRNKLALNWDVASFGDPELRAEHSFKAQYQFHF